jgi:hypothetical protein
MGPLGPGAGATEEGGRDDDDGGPLSGRFAAGAGRPQPAVRTTTAKARWGMRSIRTA